MFLPLCNSESYGVSKITSQPVLKTASAAFPQFLDHFACYAIIPVLARAWLKARLLRRINYGEMAKYDYPVLN
jgi:hypothetical protein